MHLKPEMAFEILIKKKKKKIPGWIFKCSPMSKKKKNLSRPNELNHYFNTV